jgi:hypothetical protein
VAGIVAVEAAALDGAVVDRPVRRSAAVALGRARRRLALVADEVQLRRRVAPAARAHRGGAVAGRAEVLDVGPPRAGGRLAHAGLWSSSVVLTGLADGLAPEGSATRLTRRCDSPQDLGPPLPPDRRHVGAPRRDSAVQDGRDRSNARNSCKPCGVLSTWSVPTASSPG